MTLLRTLLGQSLRPSELDAVLDSDGGRLAEAIVDGARLVSQWADNYTEWEVPPPLNAELRELQAAVDAAKEATK